MLKYVGYQVVLQEVPDEISLVFNISNCPYHCIGCHSEYLWGDTGLPIKPDMMTIIDKHIEEISCVCFMGGDHELEELISCIAEVRIRHPELMICLYTGNDQPSQILFRLCDYIKVGHYDNNLGGLNSVKTNQKMYMTTHEIKDITYKFQKNRRYEIEESEY